mmetsp:Transcript_1857/g.3317  ORF Transcript_1857/g.3317 Transcript_1857/m.3317 type:complete len:332 (+) Transcript_1857:76-1071(+)
MRNTIWRTKLSPSSQLRLRIKEYDYRAHLVGPLSVQILLPQSQSDLGLVGRHLMASTVHSDETKFSISPFSGITSHLASHLVRLPHAASDFVTQLPDPMLDTNSSAHSIVIAREHQNIKIVTTINQVGVDRHHGVLAVRLLVPGSVAAHAPLDVRLHMNSFFDRRHIEVLGSVVLCAGFVIGGAQNRLVQVRVAVTQEVAEQGMTLSAAWGLDGIQAHGVVYSVWVDVTNTHINVHKERLTLSQIATSISIDTFLLEVAPHGTCDHLVAPVCLKHRRESRIGLSERIANSKALEVKVRVVSGSVHVHNFLRQSGHVMSTVRLGTDVHLVLG